VILDESLFVLVVKDTSSLMAKMLYEVLPSSAVGPKVKGAGVSIAFADVVDSGTLCDNPPRKIPYYHLNQSTLVIKQ
jgi:hypothetical protein